MADTVLPSKKYPVRVFFFTAKPQELLDAGYDSIRVERRKSCNDEWKSVTKNLCDLKLSASQHNYNFLDPTGEQGWEYRAVVQNSVVPGTPADVPQPTVKGVDTSYEAILTIQELKEKFLWGQDSAFISDDGIPQPDYTFVMDILYGIARVEKELDLCLRPRRFVERHDWTQESMRKGYLMVRLDRYPVIELESLKLKFPGVEPFAVSSSWLQLNEELGVINVVPDSVLAYPVMPLLHRRGYVPGAIEAVYFAGFQDVPADLKECAGKEASRGPLNVGGDLVGGAGLAGNSLSLDGLSQSITTTNSSTNAGFGARLLNYDRELKQTYKALRPYYKRMKLEVA